MRIAQHYQEYQLAMEALQDSKGEVVLEGNDEVPLLEGEELTVGHLAAPRPAHAWPGKVGMEEMDPIALITAKYKNTRLIS